MALYRALPTLHTQVANAVGANWRRLWSALQWTSRCRAEQVQPELESHDLANELEHVRPRQRSLVCPFPSTKHETPLGALSPYSCCQATYSFVNEKGSFSNASILQMPNYAMHAKTSGAANGYCMQWLCVAERTWMMRVSCMVYCCMFLDYVSGLCFWMMFLNYVSGLCFWIMFLDDVSGLCFWIICVLSMFLDYVPGWCSWILCLDYVSGLCFWILFLDYVLDFVSGRTCSQLNPYPNHYYRIEEFATTCGREQKRPNLR